MILSLSMMPLRIFEYCINDDLFGGNSLHAFLSSAFLFQIQNFSEKAFRYTNSDLKNSLTLCILEIPKQVLVQTEKTQIKCSMLHFIRVYTVCIGKKVLETKECFKIIT